MSESKIHRKAFLASLLAAGLGGLGVSSAAAARPETSATPAPAAKGPRVEKEPRAVVRSK